MSLSHFCCGDADLSASVEPASAYNTVHTTVHTFPVITQKLYFESRILQILIISYRGRWSNIAFITKILHMCCRKNGIELTIFLQGKLFQRKTAKKEPKKQVRNQLWTPGGTKSFLRGPNFLNYSMSTSFKLRPTYFSRGDEKFCKGAKPPAPTGYDPAKDQMIFLGQPTWHGEVRFLKFGHRKANLATLPHTLCSIECLDHVTFTCTDSTFSYSHKEYLIPRSTRPHQCQSALASQMRVPKNRPG